jgi:hypothetical protein
MVNDKKPITPENSATSLCEKRRKYINEQYLSLTEAIHLLA